MSIFQPVNLAARRTFCPFLPIARESWSSLTLTLAIFSSSSILISSTLAGANAFVINLTGSASQVIISIFSPFSSSTIRLTRSPLLPTQAPTGSMFLSSANTANLVLSPASRDTLLISTVPL